VRIVFLRFVLAFSVIMAGIHMPATAHAETGAEHGLHRDHHSSHSEDASGQNGDTPVDVGSDVLHHHHCPMGLDPAPINTLAAMPLAKSLLVPANSAVLRSRATEPPLQPPLA
jgi:hypothetical protein